MGNKLIVVVLSHVYVSKGLLEVQNRALGPFSSSEDATKFLVSNRFKPCDNDREVRWRGYYGDLNQFEWDAFLVPVLDK
jgi:hypothetical protein